VVPSGQDVGGSFKSVPLCRADTQTGCVISYATFRGRLPPPANTRFGRARDGLRVACVNPVNLAGGAGQAGVLFHHQGFPQWLGRGHCDQLGAAGPADRYVFCH
jgi:hypothetical protein